MICAVVAMAHNNVIGKSNDLPWYLPADLKHFKDLTTGQSVIMGRKTFDSIMSRLGKPLPNRQNIVITRDNSYTQDGVTVAHSLEEAVELAASKDVYIIGGAQIFDLAMPKFDRLYITEIDADIDGDTYFPQIDGNKYIEVSREHHDKDDKNQYGYSFVTLDKTQ